MKRVTHKQFGPGKVVEDKEGLCRLGECLFRPDREGSLGRLTFTDERSALSQSATVDIVNISDLIL